MSPHLPLSVAIKRANYTGANPFTYSQVRDYPRRKVLAEFFPTSKYWSLLNTSNEVLVGTRGSGKTILLRMLSYSHYKNCPKIVRHMADLGQTFLGIYIPLRLQLLSEITTKDITQKRKQFRFIFNCVAVGSFLDEIAVLIEDRIRDPLQRLLATRRLLDGLSDLWRIEIPDDCADIEGFKASVNRRYLHTRSNWESLDTDHSLLKSGLLEPIIGAKDLVNRILNVDFETCTWMACFDEAEYLTPDLQAVINTLLRSATQGVTVKIATLPLHWIENSTDVEAVYVQKEGDDFRFTDLDYAYDSEDFIALTNNLVAVRLREIRVFDDNQIKPESAFDDFLGSDNDLDLIDLYKSKTEKYSKDSFQKAVAAELAQRPHSSAHPDPKIGEIKRYEPIVMLRNLRALDRKGNTKVPWLAGPEMARRVSGGNARRFIQLCHILFEIATQKMLMPNAQHEAVVQFAKQFCSRAKSVHHEGFLLQDFLNNLANYLEREMHGPAVRDVGLGFSLAPNLFLHSRLIAAISAGIAYSYIVRTDQDPSSPVDANSKLRLSAAFSATHWLPMRAGAGTRVTSAQTIVPTAQPDRVLSALQAESVVGDLQMHLFETDPK